MHDTTFSVQRNEMKIETKRKLWYNIYGGNKRYDNNSDKNNGQTAAVKTDNTHTHTHAQVVSMLIN